MLQCRRVFLAGSASLLLVVRRASGDPSVHSKTESSSVGPADFMGRLA